ncbi:MAG: UDP-glucose/GDP-mannose dehydrogenase family protein [Candidatus Omnitrophica bacterium]|nr:UDP-glucose/GDP-mannose dehydrogenase family protein [Candidatus Omnitrophota bacterium]
MKRKNAGKKGRFNICVIGAGYVGLVVASCFAKLKNKVICVDSNQEKVKLLKQSKIPNFEPGLPAIIRDAVKKKRLSFTTSISEAVKKSDIIFIAVGTPPRKDGEADLSAVENVARTIAQSLDSYKLIVEKSTVPVQTGIEIKKTILRYTSKRNKDFDVASNPEFLREGKAIDDFLYPDRIVIGVETKRAEKILKKLYEPIKAPVLVTDINTAEIIKHASNSFLATKISFINAVARVCEEAGADVRKVAEGIGMDARIGRRFLDAGIGFGGSCFPKDVEAFIGISKKLGYRFNLLEEVKNINISQRRHLVSKIKEELWIIKDKNIAVLGVSFKPDTDDVRESPSIDIINYLLEEGAKVRVSDPKALSKASELLKGAHFCKDPYIAVKNADCLILATEWKEFAELDFRRIKRLMRYPFIADGRNFLDRDKLRRAGFKYIGIGR